jgi:hypothetical protein
MLTLLLSLDTTIRPLTVVVPILLFCTFKFAQWYFRVFLLCIHVFPFAEKITGHLHCLLLYVTTTQEKKSILCTLLLAHIMTIFFLFFAGDVSKHKLEHAVSISTMFVYLFFNYSSSIPLFGLRTYCGSIFLGLAS